MATDNKVYFLDSTPFLNFISSDNYLIGNINVFMIMTLTSFNDLMAAKKYTFLPCYTQI